MNSKFNLRINFDTNLIYLQREQTEITPDVWDKQIFNYNSSGKFFAVLEVKYDTADLPEFIKKELQHLNVSQQSFSKYGNVFVALDSILNLKKVVL